MAGIVIKETLSKFAKALDGNVKKTMRENYTRVCWLIAGNIQREIRAWVSTSGWNISKGRLARSFKPAFIKTAHGDTVFGVYSGLKYASIHETGGPITAKAGKYLHFKVNKRTPTAIKRGKNAGKMRLKNDGGNWVKVKQVNIKPKHYLTKAAAASAGLVARELGTVLQLAVNRSAQP